MRIKVFTDKGPAVEKQVNAWLDQPGNRVISMHTSSAMWIDNRDICGDNIVTVVIEYEPL